MKIALYAICKNEAANVLDFLKMASPADSIRIVDTGSTDNTVELFKMYAKQLSLPDFQLIEAELVPFRFDVARNMALNEARKSGCDYAFFADLDERFSVGWADNVRNILELHPDTRPTILTSWMNLTDENGCIVTRYRQHKGCSLHNKVEWKYRAHEVLVAADPNATIMDTDVSATHHKDEGKSRSYLDLLAADFAENLNDHRCIFYYGRELYYAGQLDAAEAVLRTASTKNHGYFMSQHLQVLHTLYDITSALMYLYEALMFNALVPETYYKLAVRNYYDGNFKAAIGFIELMQNSEEADNLSQYGMLFKDTSIHTWKALDILSLAHDGLGEYQTALDYLNKALEHNPENIRLLKNKDYLERQVAEKDSHVNTINS